MNVYIDAHKKRSLSPNERKIYELLCQGIKPEEISEKIHMRLQNDPYLIYSDVPPDTVIGLMTSIREKGWDIPENNEEENNMPHIKTTDGKFEEIQALRNKGNSTAVIAEKTGVPLPVVQSYCRHMAADTEKEPAPAATDTSSTNPTSKDSTDSIAEKAENVKGKIPQAVMDALDETRNQLERYIEEDKDHIVYCQSKINDIDNFVKQFGGAEND